MNCCRIFTLIAVLAFVCVSASAQTVTLSGTVSETVTLSVAPTFTAANVVSSGGNTVRITLSSDDAEASVIRVPLLVRSNSGFKISAVFESPTAELAQLSVTDAHATGNLVSPYAVNALEEPREVNRDVSRPLLVLTGPRVSTGGTLNSPNNALHVTLVIRLMSPPAPGSVVHLTLIAQPVSRVQ